MHYLNVKTRYDVSAAAAVEKNQEEAEKKKYKNNNRLALTFIWLEDHNNVKSGGARSGVHPAG